MSEIIWGDGKIKMSVFVDKSDKSFGVILSESYGTHKPGETFYTSAVKNYIPKENELVLRFKNIESAKAVIFTIMDSIEEGWKIMEEHK